MENLVRQTISVQTDVWTSHASVVKKVRIQSEAIQKGPHGYRNILPKTSIFYKFLKGPNFKGCIIFLCVGGCNFPAEVVSKNFFPPPLQNTLKILPPPEDEGYSVVSSIGYAVTVGHCLA